MVVYFRPPQCKIRVMNTLGDSLNYTPETHSYWPITSRWYRNFNSMNLLTRALCLCLKMHVFEMVRFMCRQIPSTEKPYWMRNYRHIYQENPESASMKNIVKKKFKKIESLKRRIIKYIFICFWIFDIFKSWLTICFISFLTF